MKAQTRKLNMFKLFAAVLVLATILCGTMIGTGIYNASAATESFTIEPGTTYGISYAMESLDRTRDMDMRTHLQSITVKIYSKDDRELASFTREKKDDNNWTVTGNDKYTDVNGEIWTYTITYTLKEGTYEGYYWTVARGSQPFHIFDGSGEATTKKIKVDSIFITTCGDFMYLEHYYYLDISIVSRTSQLLVFYDYVVKFKNRNSNFDVTVDYLMELCFEYDAKKCAGRDVRHRTVNLARGETSGNIDIVHNGTAGSITACYVVHCIVSGSAQKKDSKIISYATNLGANSCDWYTNIVTYDVNNDK